jgi:eukaryotic-like serine/threonine-protein kinase
MSDDSRYEEFGGYQLTHLLGKGGMAKVYRAVRSGPMGFVKEVAIKRIHDSLVDNEAMIHGLINEARIGGQLKHPNIVEVYEFNKVGQAYYLALEFVDGWTLDRLLRLAKDQKMPLPPSVILEIARHVCEGLDYAHKLESLDGKAIRLVHRDLKPANIIVSRFGVTKLMDFGIAKAETNLFHTAVADVTKGTPHYMSPEQVAGDRDLTGSSDLFALGAVIYELITSKVLFAGETLPTVLFNVVRAEVGPQIADAERRLPGIGPLLERLLSKNPADRPTDAGEVSASLKRLANERYIDGPRVRDYLYAVRDHMLVGSGKAVTGPSKAGETGASVDAGGEPEFATMVGQLEETPEVDLGLAEARAAADAAIGAGVVFGAAGAPVDPSSPTRTDNEPLDEEETAQLHPLPEEQAARTPVLTNPNQKETRRVPGPTRRMKKKPGSRWSTPLLILAAALGLVLVGTVGWIIKMSLDEEPDEVVEVTDPTAAPSDTGGFDFTEPATPPKTEPKTPRAEPRTPKAEPITAAPEPVTGSEPTPIPDLPKPEPTPEPTPEARPEPPTPERVAVVEAKGQGTLWIKTSNPYARVVIDGTDTGKMTPLMRFELRAGSHDVVLVAVEMSKRSKPRRFVLEDGQNLKLGHYDFHSNDWSD